MAETKMINIAEVPGKWLKLMLHFQNTPGVLFRCVFPDRVVARDAAHCMSTIMAKHPNWFSMVMCQRGSDVYLFKPQHAQKVVIKDDVP
jgi:hypothetical protein